MQQPARQANPPVTRPPRAGWESWRWREWDTSRRAIDGRRFGSSPNEWVSIGLDRLWDDNHPEYARGVMWAAEMMQHKHMAGEPLRVEDFLEYLSPELLLRAHALGMFARPHFCVVSYHDGRAVPGPAYPRLPLNKVRRPA